MNCANRLISSKINDVLALLMVFSTAVHAGPAASRIAQKPLVMALAGAAVAGIIVQTVHRAQGKQLDTGKGQQCDNRYDSTVRTSYLFTEDKKCGSGLISYTLYIHNVEVVVIVSHYYYSRNEGYVLKAEFMLGGTSYLCEFDLRNPRIEYLIEQEPALKEVPLVKIVLKQLAQAIIRDARIVRR